MSILQQILLSLILAGCATDPSVSEGEPTGEDPSGDDSVVEQRVEPSDELRLSARELFFLRYDQEEYQVAIRGGRIQQSQIPASQSPRQLVYRLDDAPLRLFARPNYPQQLALQMTSEQQQYYHGRLLRHFFVQESPLVQVDEALVWLRWLESFVYNAEILTKKEDALQFFQDPDRLLSNINPFFYINYDGKLFSVDYLTIQENQLWQKAYQLYTDGGRLRVFNKTLWIWSDAVGYKRIWVVMLLISFLSCTKKKIDYLQLPEHSIISQDRYWGVVRVPYLRLSAGIVDEGQIEGILRAGDVVHILEIRSVYQQEAGFWRDYYHVKSVTSTLTGWITSDALELFLYEEAARRNSDRFRQRDGA